MRTAILSAILILSAGCSQAASDPGAGGLTVGETETLREAARRLDARAETPGAADSEQLDREMADRIAADQREKSNR